MSDEYLLKLREILLQKQTAIIVNIRTIKHSSEKNGIVKH